MTSTTKIIGLIPAAGRASRMGNLPFSKELLPLTAASAVPRGRDGPQRVAIDNTLGLLAESGIEETCIVIAPGKWDIPAHIGSGERCGQRVTYVVADTSPNVPASLDAAWFLTRDREVALLFPDIVFQPRHALREIIEHRRQIDADLVLALVPASSGEKVDIVAVSATGTVQKVSPKPGRDHKGWTWVAATWKTGFSQLLHEMAPAMQHHADKEIYVGDVLNAAIDAGLVIGALYFQYGNSFDLGTPDELARFWESAKISP